MVTNVFISGVEYRAINDYQIKQQGGAVATTIITVDRVTASGALNNIPISNQSAVIKIDGTTVFSGIIQKVTGIAHTTGYEPTLFDLDISSIETVFNKRLVTHNFYKTDSPTISDIVQWLYTNIIAEEGITLGAISATTESIRSYKKSYEKLSSVLDDLASRLDGCSWFVTPDKVFYFLTANDFPSAVTPQHITDVKYTEALDDLRTVQTVVGASSRIKSTVVNLDLIQNLAALSGTSGKIEVSENDSSIHNPDDATSAALKKLSQYNEREKTITLTCHDLVASALYNTWHFEPGWYPTNSVYPNETHLPDSGNVPFPLEIEGDFVVTDRTITAQGDVLAIKVSLKNRNFFTRYGYSYKKFERTGKFTTDEIADIYSDNKLSPVEKITTRKDWLAIVDEKTSNDALADSYGISRIDYDAAFQAIANYLNDGQAWISGYPLWIDDEYLSETTDYDFNSYTTILNNYASAKAILLAEINTVNSSRVFYDTPTVPYKKGDLWISDGVLYQSTVDRTDYFEDSDWEWCIRSNITTVVESTNGDVFRPGQSTTTILKPRAFKNGLEITDSLPDSAFKWTRVSFIPQSPPNDDATWNANHSSGYRTVEVSTDSINSRATYTVEILE